MHNRWVVGLRGYGVLLGGCSLAACQSSARSEPAELATFCEREEPIRLVEAGPDDHVALSTAEAVHVDGRIVVSFDTVVEGWPEPIWSNTDELRLATTIRSAGLCGEDERVVATNVDRLFDAPWSADAPLVGCERSTGSVFVLDAHGLAAPRVLLEDVECVANPVDGGAVGLRPAVLDGEYEVVFVPSVDEVATPVTLHDRVVAPVLVDDWPRLSFATTDDLVWALTADDELVQLDPATGAEIVLREHVRSFIASPSRRWILWQQGSAATTAPEAPATVHLLDLQSGEDILAATGTVGKFASRVSDDFAAITEDEATSFWLLDSLQRVDLPPGFQLGSLLAERVALVFDDAGGLWGYVIDDGTMWKPPTEHGLTAPFGDGVVMLDPVETGVYRADYWQVDLPSGHATLLADDLGFPQRLRDGSFAAVRVGEGEYYGTLEIVDGEGERRAVDSHVFRVLSSPGLLSPAVEDWPYDSDVVLWRVHDGARSGLWAARVR